MFCALYVWFNKELPLVLLPENCEVCSVIWFFAVEGNNAAEIHRRLLVVYGKNVMPI